ncbi:hypothetical protein SAMN05216206_1270 [Pseudomonas guineae]|uniref:DUF192 domain-containing protein n=1 Tax=Pseudomonas guineae TaxID=425504 RepID=A0A1I3F336_9PSED|nr:hypothetical protein SAMN05216206_1270 [Pseudomonas guineae]|tara:strand:- start:3588 stop:3938 length:351 start_codon:yes stop_codon:yes gene_type:complete
MNAQLIHQHAGRKPTELQLELAFSTLPRLRGLLGRRSLAQGHGLWIKPCNSVHCCFMRFAIDALYLDSQQRVLKIRHTLAPWQFSLCWRATSVLELAAGESRRLGIEPGDHLLCDI